MAASNRTPRPDSLAGGRPERMLQHAGDCAACDTFTPEDETPMAIVIGSRAPIESLRRRAAKHCIEPDALIAFPRGA